ncbi:hypothetical protein [Acetonema longum]|uniref:Uncharacterized protein n=1 Tax=Acetonema longum DSM 6540 TaxID=1009370 RepID=F7NEG2_9FIRM|nr:hypothetical protein [Acetonema longum]EGO65373.1 hypothetical protein ALO_02126 [Acetonema longum DSM 6540]
MKRPGCDGFQLNEKMADVGEIPDYPLFSLVVQSWSGYIAFSGLVADNKTISYSEQQTIRQEVLHYD